MSDHGAWRLRRFSVAIISDRRTVLSELMLTACDIGYGELRMRDASFSRWCGHIDGRKRSSQRAARFVLAMGAVVYRNGGRCGAASDRVPSTMQYDQLSGRSSRLEQSERSPHPSCAVGSADRQLTSTRAPGRLASQYDCRIHVRTSPHSCVPLTSARGTLISARGSLSSASAAGTDAYVQDRLCTSSACLGKATAQ
jgi:hypothetical protein